MRDDLAEIKQWYTEIISFAGTINRSLGEETLDLSAAINELSWVTPPITPPTQNIELPPFDRLVGGVVM